MLRQTYIRDGLFGDYQRSDIPSAMDREKYDTCLKARAVLESLGYSVEENRPPRMKVWLNDGASKHYSPGSPIIVVAETAERAAELARIHFSDVAGRSWKNDIRSDDMIEIDTTVEGVESIDADCL